VNGWKGSGRQNYNLPLKVRYAALRHREASVDASGGKSRIHGRAIKKVHTRSENGNDQDPRPPERLERSRRRQSCRLLTRRLARVPELCVGHTDNVDKVFPPHLCKREAVPCIYIIMSITICSRSGSGEKHVRVHS
jgi:hypothetical protein